MSADAPSDVLVHGDVLAEVSGMLRAVIGAENLLEQEIAPQTAFYADLGMESIEFVALAGRLHDRYGDQVDFVGWISQLQVDEIMGLTVGDLVDHIAARLSGQGADDAQDTGSASHG